MVRSDAPPLRAELDAHLAAQAAQRATTLGLNRYGLATLLFETPAPTGRQAAEAQRYLDGSRTMLGAKGITLLERLGARALVPVWGPSLLTGPPSAKPWLSSRGGGHGLTGTLARAAAERLADLGGTRDQLAEGALGLRNGKPPGPKVSQHLQGQISLLSVQGVQLLHTLGLTGLDVVWQGRKPAAPRP